MQSQRKISKFSVLIAFTIAIMPLIVMLFSQGKSFSMSAAQQKKASLEDQIPVAAYTALGPTDPAVRELRHARGSRYDKRRPQPISELASGVEELPLITHWESGIAALPSTQSNAVVLGNVLDAQAYLSNDKTGVYSEFTVHIKEVFKDSNQVPLKPNDAITVEREGGGVRFPSGRIQQYRIANQGMPSIGRTYVFFLKHNDSGQDFSILTAYEMRKGRVLPVDDVGQFAIYKRTDEISFLNAVKDSSKGDRNQ
jgi:hypothetical protein